MIQGHADAFAIAKMMRLMGPLGTPNLDEEYIVEEFELAAVLEGEAFIFPETGRVEPIVQCGRIREELERIESIDKGCVDFIMSLLVVDHEKRPGAREALKHPWLWNGRQLGA